VVQVIDILGLGCAAVDDVLYVDRYPPRDAKTSVLRRDRQCGGLTTAALIAAARLKVRCAYAGCLGADDASQFVLTTLAAENINTEHVRCDPTAQPIRSTIVVDEGRGTRNVFFDVQGLRSLPAKWPGDEIIRTTRALLVDHFNIDAQIHAARIAREHRAPVVADFEDLDVPGFDALLELVDHLVLSLPFAKHLTGCTHADDAVRALWHDARRAAIVTCGGDGCWLMTPTAGTGAAEFRGTPVVKHQPAFKVTAVDTTGCGDVFHGAYAAGLVRDLAVPEAARFASAAAALKATRRGGASSAPSLSQVTALLETQP
jgi:ribokinase